MTFLMWCLLIVSITATSFAEDPIEFSPSHDQPDLQLFYEQILQDILDRVENVGQDFNINKAADTLLKHVNKFIKYSGKEPISIPDINKSFGIRDWIKLHHGSLHGLSTLSRKGNIVIHDDFPKLSLSAALGFSKIIFDYDFNAKILIFYPYGHMRGTSIGSRLTIDIGIDLTTLRAKLSKFEFNSIGDLSVKLDCNFPSHVTQKLTNILLNLFRNSVKNNLENQVRAKLLKTIDAYNKIIDEIIGNELVFPA